MNKKVPKDSKISKWKEKFPWLLITDSVGDRKMIFRICNLLEEKISWCPIQTWLLSMGVQILSASLYWITLLHGHKQAVKEKSYEDSISTDSSTCPKKTYIDLLLFVNLFELIVINHSSSERRSIFVPWWLKLSHGCTLTHSWYG